MSKLRYDSLKRANHKPNGRRHIEKITIFICNELRRFKGEASKPINFLWLLLAMVGSFEPCQERAAEWHGVSVKRQRKNNSFAYIEILGWREKDLGNSDMV
ncbi:MAG TPA: hypothetical protein VKV79_08120 [Terriglobia bacterium]|nr:hypothetical protein [Terriglobia bacterium]